MVQAEWLASVERRSHAQNAKTMISYVSAVASRKWRMPMAAQFVVSVPA